MKRTWIRRAAVLPLLVLLLCCGCSKKEEPEVFTERTPVQQKEEDTAKETEAAEYRLEELNMAEGTITMRALSSGRRVRYSYDLATKFLDRYGERSNVTCFTPGQIVQIGEATEQSVLRSVSLSDQVWTYSDITNYALDLEKGVLTIGKTKYRITGSTEAFSDLAQISLDLIGSDDTLLVIGKDRNILSVVVTTGHGYLQFVNTDLFRDSLVCIGNRIYTVLTGDTVMEVPEGSYDITVANKGYGGTANYTVARNEITTVDLDLLRGEGPKKCSITFTTEVADAQVTVDGTPVPVGQALEVTYGAHVLKVTAPGYDDWQKTLIVNSPSATIALDLADEEEEEESSGGTTSGGTTSGGTTSGSASSSGTSSGGTSSGGSASSSGADDDDDDTDAEVDYLTTISEMLGNLLD